MRILTARDDALLVEVDDLDQAIALFESLAESPVAGVGEPVPGARTLLVPFRPSAVSAAGLAAELCRRSLVRRPAAAAGTVEIPTVYDGEDLAEVAGLLGWSPEELVRRHTAAAWTVGFVGFAPGFAYLTGDDAALLVPRRVTPRTRVPAGSVALAGPYSGVYPRESPGGWQLVGTTRVAVWDADRERPALLRPGDRVRFVPVPAHAVGPAARSSPEATGPTSENGPALEVVAAAVSLVEDLGRPRGAGAGASPSGALDPAALRAANRAVGNEPGAAAIEAAYGLRVRARGSLVVATAGAPAPLTVVPASGVERRPGPREPFLLHDGEELVLDPPDRGVRTYLAVRGGLDVPPVLGSRSTDVLGGLGPAPLTAGTVLPVSTPRHGLPAVDPAPAESDADPLPAPGDVVRLRIVLGPRDDWFDATAIESLTGQDWLVTERSNRVGLRLSGEALTHAREGELPSEGCVTGAIQVPPDGQPVLFLADRPVTGGYPVVGAVVAEDVPLAGQLPPGARARFVLRGPV
ncbi:urea amidolyase family protein [Antribacter sp. KLBMP9083]|uniref:Urea amidolyase family protein n=1 Tax=Antribacter soli TaxID=2910976 RepID=A0AA41U801_9MICO|nr:urea amidolyase family protein [Antribacter soli]